MVVVFLGFLGFLVLLSCGGHGCCFFFFFCRLSVVCVCGRVGGGEYIFVNGGCEATVSFMGYFSIPRS